MKRKKSRGALPLETMRLWVAPEPHIPVPSPRPLVSFSTRVGGSAEPSTSIRVCPHARELLASERGNSNLRVS